MLKNSSAVSTSNNDDALETNSLLNPTFHDVEIKVVEVVNPTTTTVKFKDHVYSYDHNSSDFNQSSVPVTSEKESAANLNPAAKNVEFSQNASTEVSVHVANIPLDFQNCASPQNYKLYKEEEHLSQSRLLKQRHKDELFQKKKQIVDSFRQFKRRSSGKHCNNSQVSRFYEVAPGIIVSERPVSRVLLNTSPCSNVQSNGLNYNSYYDNRVATVPSSKQSRAWTGHCSASSRAVSSTSSQWRREEPAISKPNMFIKMPFKQVPCVTLDNNFEVQDEIILPGEELRTTTSFALKRIRQGLQRMLPPSNDEFRQGRLLKAKLRPLRPVPVEGPRISTCRGVQPEFRAQSASHNVAQQRQLKKQYIELCKKHKQNTIEGEIKRRANAHSAVSEESIHRTSPQPGDDPDYQQDIYPVVLERDFDHNEQGEGTIYEQTNTEYKSLEHRFNLMKMDSSIIY